MRMGIGKSSPLLFREVGRHYSFINNISRWNDRRYKNTVEGFEELYRSGWRTNFYVENLIEEFSFWQIVDFATSYLKIDWFLLSRDPENKCYQSTEYYIHCSIHLIRLAPYKHYSLHLERIKSLYCIQYALSSLINPYNGIESSLYSIIISKIILDHTS